jgi:hypothetical protein
VVPPAPGSSYKRARPSNLSQSVAILVENVKIMLPMSSTSSPSINGSVPRAGSGRNYVHSRRLYKKEMCPFACPPSFESPLKIPRHLKKLLAISGAHSSVCGPLFTFNPVVGNGAMNKFGSCCQWRREPFTIRMSFFSVGKGAMNALAILATAR